MISKLGFARESLLLSGKPGPALTALTQKLKPPKDLQHLGLRVERLTRRSIVDVIKLNRQEFLGDPKHGWFCAKKKYLELMKKELIEATKQLNHSHYIILNGKKGTAGMTFVFDQSIQGRGVVKTAYRILLEDMKKLRIKTFMGGTSQKAVLSLGKLMKQEPTCYILRFGSKTFKSSDFGPW